MAASGGSANLVRTVTMRLRQIKLTGSWEYRPARLVVSVRVVSGIWLLVLTAILYGYGAAAGGEHCWSRQQR